MARKSRKAYGTIPDVQKAEILWKCVLYFRVSNDDPEEDESNSITNQRKVAYDYLKRHPEIVFIQEFVDDGRTGTTYQRTGFEQMMHFVRAGQANCIIVKDLSRFGRNYIDSENYITVVFPFLGVRFISILDTLDFEEGIEGDKLLQVRFQNIANDYYAKQVSANVSPAFKKLAEKGVYHGPVPPYGYLIRSDGKGKRYLVKEEGYAEIVKEMFELYHSGISLNALTKYLNQKKIAPPFRHFTDLGLYKSKRNADNTMWYKSTVRGILENPAYCGCLPEAKSERALYKNVPLRKVPKNEWKLVEKTHEPIVERSLYNKVQELLEINKEEAMRKVEQCTSENCSNIFAGVIRCGRCQGAVRRSYYTYGKNQRTHYFKCCAAYYFQGHEDCTAVYINEKKLKNVVFQVLQKHFLVLVGQFNELEQKVSGERYTAFLNSNNKLAGQFKNELEQLKVKKRRAYVEYKEGIVSEEEYFEQKLVLGNHENRITENLRRIQMKKEEAEHKLAIAKEQIQPVLRFQNEESLCKEMIAAFVESIQIISANKVAIKLRYQDEFLDTLRLMEDCCDESL